MGKNTSISLGNHFENFVETSISLGRFKNVSEVVRAGLRLLEEEESRVTQLKHAIEDGIKSGRADHFDSEKHLARLKVNRKSNG